MRLTGLLTALAILAAVPAAQADSIVTGSGAAMIKSTSTGIYQINLITNGAGEKRETLALVRDGALIEAHTRKLSSKAYLARSSTSTAVKKTTSAFDQLIAAAGGINKDVDAIGGTAKSSFYSIAGFSATSPPPPRPSETTPVGDQCPAGYELVRVKFNSSCRLITSIWDQFKHDALLVLGNSGIIAPAFAFYYEFSFSVNSIFNLSRYNFVSSNSVGGSGIAGFRMQAFGFDFFWVDTPGD